LGYLEVLFGSFFVIRLMPIRLTNSGTRVVPHVEVDADFAILMQGPIIQKNDFTIETLKFYRLLYPNARLVLSTWNTEDKVTLEKIKNIGIEVVASEVPEVLGKSNVNLQLKSTNAGLSSLGKHTKYILKTRTDQRIYSSDDWLRYLAEECELSTPEAGLERKLIVCNLNMYRSRKYLVSDMFMFGRAKDISLFWNIPQQIDDINVVLDTECFGFHGAETYLMRHFLKVVDWNVTADKVDSSLFLRAYFHLIDKHSLDLFWFKYNHFYDRKYKSVDGGRSEIVSVIDSKAH
jgi:hypothetical protein|tara:strand:+ start:3600 stop:4472 length:873 start_codon:yes stop_codon:yes gene_type:complete